jgi:large conductance mechanosensitive channel
MWKEFREFINRGSVMDLAVGVIMGAAFGKIVSSAVDDLIGPILGLVLGRVKLSEMRLVILSNTLPDGKVEEVAFKYGSFAQHVIDFLIVAVVIFLVVKTYNRFKKTAPPPPPNPTESLLAEIRDLLKKQ